MFSVARDVFLFDCVMGCTFSELEAKQRAELTMRNIQLEMRAAQNTIREVGTTPECRYRKCAFCLYSISMTSALTPHQTLKVLVLVSGEFFLSG